jgi:hypothetical protein
MSSLKAQISNAVAAKLAEITTANGYGTNVQAIYYDKIPMGMQLEPHELPAILMLAGDDNPKMKNQCWFGSWEIYLQLINGDVDDSAMDQFVRDVFKNIYAGDATSQRNTAFKSLHPSIYNIEPISIEPDLNMIDANRCYVVGLLIQYTTKLYDL